MNFPNHLIAGFDFPQIFIPTTQGGPIWAIVMYLLTKPNYMEEILFVLVQFSLGITFKIFIEISDYIHSERTKPNSFNYAYFRYLLICFAY